MKSKITNYWYLTVLILMLIESAIFLFIMEKSYLIYAIHGLLLFYVISNLIKRDIKLSTSVYYWLCFTILYYYLRPLYNEWGILTAKYLIGWSVTIIGNLILVFTTKGNIHTEISN